MKKLIPVLATLALILAFPKTVYSADKMVFDSTNKYLGACDFTDKSEWTLERDYDVTIFEVWYKWNQNETVLPVTIMYDGKEFAKFEATRASCDPYQTTWCNADFSINKVFPKGTYTTTIPNKRQCLKPGGTGAIRLYEKDTDIVATPTATTIPTITPTSQPPTTTPIAAYSQSPTQTKCPCTNTIAVSVVLSSLASSLISFFIVKKFK